MFKNVTVTKKANIYYDGKVTSRKIEFADGSSKTLGIMQVGEYTFATKVAETMEMITGKVDILLPNETNWKTIPAGKSFQVPANSKFGIKVHSTADYCCSYLA